MAHIVFMVHGMGSHGDDWADSALDALRSDYSQLYPQAAGRYPLSAEFVPISYDEIFEDYLTEARRHAEQLGNWQDLVPLPTGGGGSLARQLAELALAPPSEDFIVTHIGDVLLYMLTNFRERVKGEVIEKISAKLRPGAPDGWSIIAHSLGTRIINDALQQWATTPALNFYGSFGKPHFVMMVANVTRVLQWLVDGNADAVYQNAVYPDPNGGVGACTSYISAHHELDPFTCLRPYRPPDPSREGMQVLRINADEITDKNPHDIAHYLKNPKIHRALLTVLANSPFADPFRFDDTAAVDAAFKQEVRDLQNAAIVAELKRRMPKETATVEQVIENWKRFLEFVR